MANCAICRRSMVGATEFREIDGRPVHTACVDIDYEDVLTDSVESAYYELLNGDADLADETDGDDD